MARWRRVATPGCELPLTGTQGWEQFLGAKKEMLDRYDKAKGDAKAEKVQTSHGVVGEAHVRDWLRDFLPKRYGVTSGSIVSQGQTDKTKLPQFDVIIYDQIESPTLWIKGSPDTRPGKESRAIPAEYVRCVLEVKSAFNSESVSEALKHLADLDPLLADVDSLASGPFKKFLPPRFFTAVVFFELRDENRNAWAQLFKFVPETLKRGWPIGLILRGDGLRPEFAATIRLTRSAESPPMPIERLGRDLLAPIVLSDSRPLAGTYGAAQLTWTSNEFAEFAFDLLAILNGTYQPGRSSSSHGMSWIDYPEPAP